MKNSNLWRAQIHERLTASKTEKTASTYLAAHVMYTRRVHKHYRASSGVSHVPGHACFKPRFRGLDTHASSVTCTIIQSTMSGWRPGTLWCVRVIGCSKFQEQKAAVKSLNQQRDDEFLDMHICSEFLISGDDERLFTRNMLRWEFSDLVSGKILYSSTSQLYHVQEYHHVIFLLKNIIRHN